MQALTFCDAKVMSTCTTAGQFKCQFKGLSRNCHRRFRMQTLTCCDGAEVTSTRTTVGQFKGALVELSGKVQKASTHSLSSKIHEHARSTAATVSSRGQWNVTCVGSIRRKTHIAAVSSVVMDIAAFKVCHSFNIDATALRAARTRSSTIGAMDEMSQKVQNASTHPLGRKHHEHAHSSWSVQGSVQGGDG
jgi:hypothetical protein